MPDISVNVPTRDGQAACVFFTPAGEGPWPGVVYFTDVWGIRPATREMAARVAARGYAVLLPNIFYRTHTPATYHLLSARRLKLMKTSAYIVNTARGEVIDEPTMARMLEAGQLSGAGLDVFENEPAVNPKLLKARNVVLLPHMGSATIEGRTDMGEKVIINIRSFVDGHKPPDRVIPAML